VRPSDALPAPSRRCHGYLWRLPFRSSFIALVVHPNLAAAAASGVACIALVVAAWADARTGFIFDALTLPAGALAASLAALSGAGGEAAAGVTLLVGTFGALVVFSRGRWMGLGDVKAMYALGAAFGPTESLVALLAACACGIVAAAWHGKIQRGYEVRFGPHLAAGAAFALAAGAPLVHGIMGF